MYSSTLVVLCTLTSVTAAPVVPSPEPPRALEAGDEEMLRAARLPYRGDEVLTFFRTRVAKITDPEEIQPWIAKLGDEDTAERHCMAARATWPDGIVARVNLALLEEDRGTRARLLEEILVDQPEHFAAGSLLAGIRHEQGRLEEALTLADAALPRAARDEDLLDLHLLIGRSLWGLDRRGEAVESLVGFLERQADPRPFAPAVEALGDYRSQLAPGDVDAPLRARLEALLAGD